MKKNPSFQAKEIEIPKLFKTHVSEKNFTNCISCGGYLLDKETEYVIEKVFKDNTVEAEYAMCLTCVEEMRKQLSEESLQRIGDYFESHFDFYGKRYHLFLNEIYKLKTSIFKTLGDSHESWV